MDIKGIDISCEPEDLICYGFDASGMKGRPALVAWPKTTQDIVSIMSYAKSKGMPVVPRGAGTGMTAGSVPIEGALVLSLEKMNNILDIDRGNLNCVVEPGLINGTLQRALMGYGFFYPPDPASMDFCTLGGNVAENAGGPRALKYGVTRDYIMEIEAVLPSGDVINTGVKTHKGVVGYDIARLLTGSEGTLAVISKIRFKIIPIPEAIVTLLGFFGSVESAGQAVSGITEAKIIPRTLEFMDKEAMRAVEAYKPAGLPSNVEALLLIELDGHPKAIESEAMKVADICREYGADVEAAADEYARERLWQARRAVSPALHNLGLKKINEDIVVPRSRLSSMLGSLKRLTDESGIKIVNFGHAGDGNIHVNIMSGEGQIERAHALVGEIFKITLELGGTISGEHGVGLTKAPYIDMEIKEREMSLMRAIKTVFDPANMLNPGKIFKT